MNEAGSIDAKLLILSQFKQVDLVDLSIWQWESGYHFVLKLSGTEIWRISGF